MKPRVPGCLIGAIAVVLAVGGTVVIVSHAQPFTPSASVAFLQPVPSQQAGCELDGICTPGMAIVAEEIHGASTTQRTLVQGRSLRSAVVRFLPNWFLAIEHVAGLGAGWDPAGWNVPPPRVLAPNIPPTSVVWLVANGAPYALYDRTSGATRTALVLRAVAVP